MGLNFRAAALGCGIALSLLALGSTPARAQDGFLRFDADGGGAGGGGVIHDQPRVTAATISASPFALQNGVRIYSGFASTGARFGRFTNGREFHGNDGEKEREEDETTAKNLCDATSDGAAGSELTKGNPIYLPTGNKIEPELDFASEGEWPLYLRRTYNHQWSGVGLFGWRWVSSFDYRLSFEGSYASEAGVCYAQPSIAECTNTSTANTIWVHRPDGRKLRFDRSSDGTYYQGNSSQVARIVRQADGTWMHYGEDNQAELYSVGGYPLNIRNESGVAWSFRYGGLNGTQVQEVTHTSGRSVQFIWVDDELREIRDPAGRAYTFTYTLQKVYTGLHVLKSVTTPGPSQTVTTYHYDGEAGEPDYDRISLTGKSYNGQRYSWFTYDARGRATSSQHANGVEKYSFSYTDGAQGVMTVAETNPLGKQASYIFKGGKTQNVSGLQSAQCGASYKETSYDANGNVDLVADFNGNFSNFDYAADGRLQQLVEAFGTSDARTTSYTWDSTRNLVTGVTLAGLSKTEYSYTSGNRVAEVRATNLSSNGVTGQVRITTYRYTQHPNGLLSTAQVDGPLSSDTVVYSYNTQGDLVEIRNELGQAVTYSNYNAFGQPGKEVDANGAVTEYQYDERGRLKVVSRIINGVAQPTTYSYDAFGRLATVSFPDGRVRTREFDPAWRVTREYEKEVGNTWAVNLYSYNNASQVTSVVTQRTTALNPPGSTPSLSVPGYGYSGVYSATWSTVSGAEFYRLEEGVGSTWAIAYEGSAANYRFTGKPAGSYVYKVTACNAAGCSAPSASATTQVLYPPPSAPTISAPSQNTDGSIPLSWNPIQAASQYQLEESINGGPWVLVHDGGTSLELPGRNAATYGYRARGYNGAGPGPWSAVVYVTEIDPPGAPPNIFGPAVNTSSAYSITWTSVGDATYYALEESANGGGWNALASSGTSVYVSGRSTGIDYAYRVRACNSAGCSGYSPSAIVQRIIYGAQFVNQSTPATIRPGQAAGVWVQMRNTGNTTWTADEAYRLGSQNLADNTRWGLSRVPVPGPIAPGQVATFSFTIVGPAGTTSGGRSFQWQMVRDGVTWFGEITPNVSIYLDVPFQCPPTKPNCQPP